METKIDFSQTPHGYQICLNQECTQAKTCLRQLAAQTIPAEIHYWSFINPTYLASLKGACPYYRSAAKVRFAKGFIKLLENLPYKQMQTVISHLINHFDRRTYYRVRKGERLLSPSEQQKMLNVLKNCGVSHPQEFDAYIEDYEW